MPSDNSLDQKGLLDLLFKVLSALIIPVFIWVNNISVQIALLERDQSENASSIKECKSSMTKVELNAQALGQIKEDLERTRKMLEEIRTLLQEKRP